jgi:hypothetical protein
MMSLYYRERYKKGIFSFLALRLERERKTVWDAFLCVFIFTSSSIVVVKISIFAMGERKNAQKVVSMTSRKRELSHVPQLILITHSTMTKLLLATRIKF